jgi:hypothetical protein
MLRVKMFEKFVNEAVRPGGIYFMMGIEHVSAATDSKYRSTFTAKLPAKIFRSPGHYFCWLFLLLQHNKPSWTH